MGGCEGNPYPTLQTFITGIDTPFAEGGTAFLRRTFLRFFFLSVCHTPKELFDLLADDYRTYLEIELTKGKREVTEDDEREADALCKQYLERWKEEQK